MADGFFFEELSEFKKDLMREANEIFPEKMEAFLKKEGRKLSNLQKKIAKQDVGTSKGKKKDWEEETSYRKHFKVSKTYNSLGDKFIKSYNNAKHAHLIEYGHRMCKKDGSFTGKFVPGRYVIQASKNQFKHEFAKDCDEFLSEYYDDIGKH